jgi:hypothetical protein
VTALPTVVQTALPVPAAAHALASIAFDPLTTAIGLAALTALVLLLLVKEIVRANPGRRGYPRLGAFDLVILPLLLLFAVVVAVRLVALLLA